jgi:hypothetical protein
MKMVQSLTVCSFCARIKKNQIAMNKIDVNVFI